MLLKKRLVLAASLLVVGFATFSCTDDAQVEETVTPTPATQEAASAAAPDTQSFTGEAVYFAFDDYTLNSESQGKLNKLGEHLKGKANAVVQIEGHCDERGSVEYNLALGERRAQSVKNYLVQLGIEAARLTTISYGEEKPVAEGHTEDVWAKNRRAEFVISNQ